jgi:hypothetical protein
MNYLTANRPKLYRWWRWRDRLRYNTFCVLPVHYRYLFILVFKSGRNRFCFPLSPYLNCTSWPGLCYFQTRDTYWETGDPAGLPAQLAGRWGQKWIETVFGGKKIFCTGPTRAAKAEQKSLVPARQAQQTNQGRNLSFVLFEPPFTSVSTVSRATPLQSLCCRHWNLHYVHELVCLFA